MQCKGDLGRAERDGQRLEGVLLLRTRLRLNVAFVQTEAGRQEECKKGHRDTTRVLGACS